ncbi:terminase TerL endonuclease subunit [candidate division KSB1 bacterium]
MAYRSKESYLAKGEKRQNQLNNLKYMRGKKSKTALIETPKIKDSLYSTDIIKFAEEQFYIETRKPIILEEWQKEEILKPIFMSTQYYSLAVVSMPKKNGKSTLSAIVGLWYLLYGNDFSEIYVLSRDLSQSQMVIFNKMVNAATMNKQMLPLLKITKDTIEMPSKDSFIKAIPMDISISGVSPDLLIGDEIWSFEQERMRKVWDELTTIPTKKMLTFITSYAGYNEEDEEDLLWNLYKKGLKGDDLEMFFYWSHENKASWVTKQYLKTQKKRLRKNTYLRLHENRWTSGEENFIDMEMWDKCCSRKHKPLLPSKNIYVTVAVDIGYKNDNSAVVVVTKEENTVKLVSHKIWIPSKFKPLDIEETVENYIKELNESFTINGVYYDPYQFHRSATTLEKERIPMKEFPQTVDRLTEMAQNLYDLITNENILMYKNAELRRHAQNSKAKETQRGWRIIKKTGSKKIDAIISLAMACLGAVKIDDSRPNIRILEPSKEVNEEQYWEKMNNIF